MISKIATIKKDSLNPQFVIEIAQKCSSFDSSITMYAKDQTVNLKSIVNIFGTSIENDDAPLQILSRAPLEILAYARVHCYTDIV